MPAEVSMVTMKMLSNNKGVALIVLIVAMTLIAILGTSFVSLIGSKQKGFLYQINSYRALNIANAGVEYAIRYVSDGLSDTTNPSNNFFNNPSAAVTRGFAGGTFTFTYDHINNRITVTGNYPDPSPVSRRDVRLSSFRRYLSPITLVPDVTLTDRVPSVNTLNNRKIIMPVINNNEVSTNVSRIDVSVNLTGKYLKYVLFEGGSPVFDFDLSSYTACVYPSSVPCKDATQGGIYMPTNYQVRFDLTGPNTIAEGSVKKFTLEFTDSALSGQYKAIFVSPQLANPSGPIIFNINI
jgi:hypothetical protein